MSAHRRLTEATRRVIEARERQRALAASINEKRLAFEESIAWMIEDKRDAENEVSAAEEDLKSLALEQYERTQERAPLPGVDVKLFTVMDYDPADALRWAKETTLALVPESLDKKTFEKIASATELPFVTFRKEPRVQLAKTLTVVEHATAADARATPVLEEV